MKAFPDILRQEIAGNSAFKAGNHAKDGLAGMGKGFEMPDIGNNDIR